MLVNVASAEFRRRHSLHVPMFNGSFIRRQRGCGCRGRESKAPPCPSPHLSAEEVLMVGRGVENQDLLTGKILREILGLPTVSLSQLTRCQIFCVWLEFFQRSVVMLSHADQKPGGYVCLWEGKDGNRDRLLINKCSPFVTPTASNREVHGERLIMKNNTKSKASSTKDAGTSEYPYRRSK